jgi:propanediol utilization protein
MHASVDALAARLVGLLTIEMEASGRHIHLCRAHVDALFGPGYQLTAEKALSQPGQFVCRERVTLVGPRGELRRVAVLGPERGETQVEVSLTDAAALGLAPPVRQSGDLTDTPGLTVKNGDRSVTLDHGLIAARRHIHMTPQDAARWGLSDDQTVDLQTLTARGVVFQNTVVRVSPHYATRVHLDYDEANACGFQKGDLGVILL